MKFSLSWLKIFLDTRSTIEDIAVALNSLGIEVESVVDRSKEYSDFIVGLVEEVKKHPNADKLNWCKVNDGSSIIDIVTGASNVREGMKVVIAPVGSVIPTNKLKMEKRSLRGIESHGMLCSSAELGLGNDGAGIMDLPSHYKAGTRLIEAFPELGDAVIEVSITPNRSDCLGVYGIARELAAYGLGKLKNIESNQSLVNAQNHIKVLVANSEDCPLYIGRYFTNVTNKESPEWLKSLLRSIGDTPISALVDITNYISYSFARPLHVYDANSINGNIEVRRAKDEEPFLDLDKKEYKLSAEDIVIADKEKVLGLAGIMGGDTSKCEMNSTNIYLEAAVFAPPLISKSSKRHKINSEAKHIFERGVDHNFTMLGAIIGSQMIQEICGGNASDFSINGNVEIGLKSIEFDVSKIKKIGGIEIEEKRVCDILRGLGFLTPSDSKKDYIKLQIPSWRHDINSNEDLVEEVLRLYGYNHIPNKKLMFEELPDSSIALSKYMESRKSRAILVPKGYHEVVTYSFMSQDVAKKFGSFNEDLLIMNPISSDLDVMRSSILPNLLNLVGRNNARSIKDLSIFEIGPVFNSSKIGDQTRVVAGLRAGSTARTNIYKDSRSFDFFDVRSDIYDLLKIWNIENIEITREGVPAWYHPGKSATLKFKGKVIGYCGELNSTILESTQVVVGFELFLDLLEIQTYKKIDDVSDYQASSRDFAFIVDMKTPSSVLVKTILGSGSGLVKDAHIFDVYQDQAIGGDKKSIAIRVVLQASNRTLSNDEIESVCTKIIDSVKGVGGELRLA